jgi:hypothetical protein
MKLKTLWIACFCCITMAATAQISLSSSVLNFFTVIKGSPSTINLTITNNSAVPFVVTDIDAYHTDAFKVQDTAFTINPGNNRVVPVTCDPRHNVHYADWLLIKSSSHPYVPHAFMYAFAKYAEAYYDATHDLYNEALETAIKTTITTGYTGLGYDDARDKLFMIIDNQAVNGQGASQNTLECIYTGFMAVGFGNRIDAQTNFNLNTEHTMPQSLFNSNVPMYSDMHHLFVSTAASNSERGNNPFGVVANPTWSQGGSKSNGSIFEPRDAQKGASARALLYFYLRYQDYQGFICAMEPILRTWNANFPPDSIDVTRNDDVFFFQHNRNPFVDHPEFMERIGDLCGVDNGDPSPIAEWTGDTLQYGSVASGNSLDGYYVIANQGINAMTLSNLSLSSPEFTFIGTTNVTIPKDSLRRIWVRFTPSATNQNFAGTLTFNTDAPATAARTVHLLGTSFPVGIAPVAQQPTIALFPQPARELVTVQLNTPAQAGGQLRLWNLSGQELRTIHVAQGEMTWLLPLSGLPKGVYLLQIQLGDAQVTEKLIVE